MACTSQQAEEPASAEETAEPSSTPTPEEPFTPSPELVRVDVDTERYPDALCNDGTPGVYYQRPGRPGTRRWVIMLEGGGACASVEECQRRRNTRPELLTSDPSLHGERLERSGMLSVDAELNPLFYDAHHINVLYCSSDWWSGARGPVRELNGMYMRGHTILMSVLDQLEQEGLGEATELLLVGASAGGIGVELNLDLVAGMYPNARVQGVQDAMWPSDPEPFRPPDFWETLEVEPWIEERLAWNTPVYDDCYATLDDPRCFERHFFTHQIATPMFVRAAQQDAIWLDSVQQAVERAGHTFDAELAQEGLLGSLRDLEPRHAVFSPDVETHVTIHEDSFFHERIDGVSAMDLLRSWWTDRAEGIRVIE